MHDFRPHRSEPEPGVPEARRPDHDRHPTTPDPDSAGAGSTGQTSDGVESLRVPPLIPRRHTPWLLVELDESGSRHGALVWGLREAARREATVLAVTVVDDDLDHPLGAARSPSTATRTAALQLLEAQVLQAIAETGVHGRVRTAVLERAVFEALSAAASGADLVIVGTWGKTLLRPAVGRPPFRRLSRGA